MSHPGSRPEDSFWLSPDGDVRQDETESKNRHSARVVDTPEHQHVETTSVAVCHDCPGNHERESEGKENQKGQAKGAKDKSP